jgi:hypothetical protein
MGTSPHNSQDHAIENQSSEKEKGILSPIYWYKQLIEIVKN